MEKTVGSQFTEKWTSWTITVLLLIMLTSSVKCTTVEIASERATKPKSRPGVMTMCPPGGEAFTTAWQLTCGMKRKRSINLIAPQKRNSDRYRPLSLTEMMKFCCRYGCSFRDLAGYCDPFED
ncbi:IlGF domain-containing protein [Aphelenchoides besseyi]|nr:IlGF domain-containing protein [Aphelenchoides besseyi]